MANDRDRMSDDMTSGGEGPKRREEGMGEERMPVGGDDVRGIADEGEDEFEDTEDTDEEEEEER